MKAGVLLKIVRDIVTLLETEGILTATDDFNPPDLNEDLKLASAIESILKNRGITLPAEVDKVMNSLPLVFQLVKNFQ